MIDSKLNEELRNKYNPDGSALRNHQMILVDLLKDFDAICKANGINYWLSYGTCLGAIRHSGFIPWDDDIDVEMLYDDYIKFEKVFKEDDRLALQTYDNDLFYTQPFSKLRLKGMFIKEGTRPKRYKYNGPFIDLFCMEHAPYWLAVLCHKSVGAMRLYAYRIKDHGVQLLIYKTWKKFNKCLVLFCRFVSKCWKTDTLRHTCGVGNEKKIRKESEIFPLSEAMFEGYSFPVPGDYHHYLERLYGDYMELPKIIHTHSLHLNSPGT